MFSSAWDTDLMLLRRLRVIEMMRSSGQRVLAIFSNFYVIEMRIWKRVYEKNGWRAKVLQEKEEIVGDWVPSSKIMVWF
jgi:hypothetical protein